MVNENVDQEKLDASEVDGFREDPSANTSNGGRFAEPPSLNEMVTEFDSSEVKRD